MASGSLVLDKGQNLLGRGRKSREVEIDSSKKLDVVAKIGRQNLHALPFGGGEPVDLVVCRRLLPHEAPPVTHYSEGGGGITTLVTSQDGSLASAKCGHQADLIVLCDLTVAAGHDCLASHVADYTVRESGDHTNLLGRADFLHNGIIGKKFDFINADSIVVELGSRSDPIPNDAVVLGILLRDLPSLMRDQPCWLKEHEALAGGRHVRSARSQVVREGADVVDCVVASQGELKSLSSVLGAMASAGIAAQLGNNRINVPNEVRNIGLVQARDLDGNLNPLAREFADDLSGTVL